MHFSSTLYSATEELNTPIRIVFEEAEQQALAYDGDKPIGECQYDVDSTGKWIIVHTGVRPEYWNTED